ncbi:MAG: hypothetical protein KAV00_06945 [Phycisphaerae bacterium]|nr:hypothetical protein [Phycisphaerae bacterium]
MELVNCVYCGKTLTEKKIRRHAKYCDTECYRKCQGVKWRKLNPRTGIPTATVGAMHELVVAADLLKRGLSVFRALSSMCSCDLVILRGKQLLRVEVTTGYIGFRGKNGHPSKDKSKFDLLAVVINDEIMYSPNIEDL